MRTDDGSVGSTPTMHVLGTGESFPLTAQRLIVAGYTGRDALAVQAHIDELAAIGVPPPATVPTFYELDTALLTTEPVIEVSGPRTSGEVEPVLVRHAGAYFLGIGSDHTDRDLETRDIGESKAACPKPIGQRLIALGRLDDLEWDAIEASSTVDGRSYQNGRLSALRLPSELMALLAESRGERGEDLVVFAGTLPLLDGGFVCGSQWQLAMAVPDGTTLTHSYEVKRRIP